MESEKSSSSVLIAKSLSDIFYHIKTLDSLQLLGGCTRTPRIGDKAITVRNIPELCMFEKKERYITFGPGVTLSQILSIGSTNMPSVFYEAVSSIGNSAVRNVATIGGNICTADPRCTLYAPLLALKARLEFKSPNETKFIPFSSFKEIPKGYVLTGIRIPTEEWEVAIFRRFGPSSLVTKQSASFAFLVQTERGIITSIGIAYSGEVVFHSPEFESRFLGLRLPIGRRMLEDFMQDVREVYKNKCGENKERQIVEDQFLNIMRYSLEQLT